MVSESGNETTLVLPAPEVSDRDLVGQNGLPEKGPFLPGGVVEVGADIPSDAPVVEKQQLANGKASSDKPEVANKRRRGLITALLLVTFLINGMGVAILGPTLLELEAYTDSSTKQMSTVFTWRYLGTIGGVISAGFLYDRLDPHLLMGGALMLVAGLLTGAVWWTQLGLMCGTFLVQGFIAGAVSVGTNVVCLGMWGRKSGPYIQSLHLAATLGATLSPQIAKPFLTQTMKHNPSIVHCNGQHNATECLTVHLASNSTADESWDSPPDYTVPLDMGSNNMKFQFAYIIISGLMVVMSVLHIGVFFYDGCQAKRAIRKADTCSRKQHSPAITKAMIVQYMSLFVLLSAFYGAMEDMYGGLLVAFVVKYLGMEEGQGSNLVSLLFGCISAGRGISAFVSRCMRPSAMLCINMVLLVTCSSCLTLTKPGFNLPLWICTAGVGLGLSSTFPSAIHWASTIMQASGSSTSAFFSGLSIGKMVGPPILGYMFDELSPRWFIYSILIGSVGLATVYVLICILRLYHKRNAKSPVLKHSADLPSLHVTADETDV